MLTSLVPKLWLSLIVRDPCYVHADLSQGKIGWAVDLGLKFSSRVQSDYDYDSESKRELQPFKYSYSENAQPWTLLPVRATWWDTRKSKKATCMLDPAMSLFLVWPWLYHPYQCRGSGRHLKMGGKMAVVCSSKQQVGGSGGMLPQEFFGNQMLWNHFWGTIPSKVGTIKFSCSSRAGRQAH